MQGDASLSDAPTLWTQGFLDKHIFNRSITYTERSRTLNLTAGRALRQGRACARSPQPRGHLPSTARPEATLGLRWHPGTNTPPHCPHAAEVSLPGLELGSLPLPKCGADMRSGLGVLVRVGQALIPSVV